MHSVLFSEMDEIFLIFYREFFKHGLFQNTIASRITNDSGPQLLLITNENHSFDPKRQESVCISPWSLSSFIHNTNIRTKRTVFIKFEWVYCSGNDNIDTIHKIIVAFHVNWKENIGDFLSSLKLFNFIHDVLGIVIFCSIFPDYQFVNLLVYTEHISLLVHFLQCLTTVVYKHVDLFHLYILWH